MAWSADRAAADLNSNAGGPYSSAARSASVNFVYGRLLSPDDHESLSYRFLYRSESAFTALCFAHRPSRELLERGTNVSCNPPYIKEYEDNRMTGSV